MTILDQYKSDEFAKTTNMDLVMRAIGEVGKGIAGVQSGLDGIRSQVHEDVNTLHTKIDTYKDRIDNGGCTFGKLNNEHIKQNTQAVEKLAARPEHQLSRLVSFAAIASTVIALVSLLISLALK